MITTGYVNHLKDWGGLQVEEVNHTEGCVTLHIPRSCRHFTARDLKELRKVLKELQRDLEQSDLSKIVI